MQKAASGPRPSLSLCGLEYPQKLTGERRQKHHTLVFKLMATSQKCPLHTKQGEKRHPGASKQNPVATSSQQSHTGTLFLRTREVVSYRKKLNGRNILNVSKYVSITGHLKVNPSYMTCEASQTRGTQARPPSQQRPSGTGEAPLPWFTVVNLLTPGAGGQTGNRTPRQLF